MYNYKGAINVPQKTDDQIVSEYVKNNTVKIDEIYVWGYAPSIYLLSERRSFSEAVHFFPLAGTSHVGNNYNKTVVNWTRTEFMKDLNSHPPKLIIIKNNYGREIEEFEEFNSFFKENYVYETQIESAEIYRLK